RRIGRVSLRLDRTHHARLNRAGADCIHSYAKTRHVGCRRLCQPEHAMLGSDIGGHSRPAKNRRNRSAVHDGARPLSQHHRKHMTQPKEDALEVDDDDPIEHRLVVFLSRRNGALNSGIVEKAIDSAVRLERYLHITADVVSPRDVGAHEARYSATLLNQLGASSCAGLVDIGDHDFGAAGGETKRSRLPDIATATGDQCNFALEIHHLATLLARLTRSAGRWAIA